MEFIIQITLTFLPGHPTSLKLQIMEKMDVNTNAPKIRVLPGFLTHGTVTGSIKVTDMHSI
jgi:hypothetical protein